MLFGELEGALCRIILASESAPNRQHAISALRACRGWCGLVRPYLDGT